MAIYRGKYILEGLGTITPQMEHNLDIAYDICMSYKDKFPCEMCGRCCHQPNITIRPEEINRVAQAADIPIYNFMTEYVAQTSDGRFMLKKTNPCVFLGPDRRCKIWKDRPQICDDFPYAVSMFMSRVYLALTNSDADINELIAYMEDEWPCSKIIKESVKDRIEERRKDIVPL